MILERLRDILEQITITSHSLHSSDSTLSVNDVEELAKAAGTLIRNKLWELYDHIGGSDQLDTTGLAERTTRDALQTIIDWIYNQ